MHLSTRSQKSWQFFVWQFFFWYWTTWTNHTNHWKTFWQKISPWIFQAINLIGLNHPIGQKSHHTKDPCDVCCLVERRLNCWKSLLSKKFICLNLDLPWLMLISWTKLLLTIIVNKRKIQNKLKSLFASIILGFRPAAKRASTTDETDVTESPLTFKRCHVDMPTTSSMQYSSLESMGELMDTEDTQQPTYMSPSQVSSSGGNNKEEAN